MLKGLGQWLAANRNDREKWPDFLFFGGDQIYSDEIGDDHGAMLIQGRFAARIPGPVDPAATARAKLVDGAWAGRFRIASRPSRRRTGRWSIASRPTSPSSPSSIAATRRSRISTSATRL